MKQKQHDFTEGNIFKQLIVFSGPLMAANLLQTSYQFIDSLWVGNLLGANALGAVAVSGTIIFTVLSFVIGMNNAVLAILSQQKGMKNEEGLRRYLNAFVVILSAIAIGLGIIGFVLAKPFLQLLGTPESMMEEAAVYLQINFLGILFLFGYNFISTVLRALGDRKTPMRFVMIAVGLNIVLDPLFISGFGWAWKAPPMRPSFPRFFLSVWNYLYDQSGISTVHDAKFAGMGRSKTDSSFRNTVRAADGGHLRRVGSDYERGYHSWRECRCRL